MSFGDEAAPEDGSAFSEAEAAEQAADAAAATSGDNGNGNGNGNTGEPAHAAALVEEADPKELLVRERDEYLLALQRTQADFENYRKRIARLQEEQSNRAAASLVEKLLPVLDALDLAEAHLNASLEVSE